MTLFRPGLTAALVCAAALSAACGDDEPVVDDDGSGGEGGTLSIDVPAEAGFIDVPAATVGWSYPSRLFYSFVPADEHPESAPLVVFFNGGPGAATTSILLPYGTGPYTLDPLADPSAPPVPNAHSYTRFANLLYIDARSAGFSYDLESETGAGCVDSPWLYLADAGDFTYALLEFLEAHAPLRDNPVVLAGESYGGTRAPLMLYMLQHYAVAPELELGMPAVSEHAPWLHEKMQKHLDAAFPESSGHERTPDQVAEQFGWQLLIQPSIFGQMQAQFQRPLLEADRVFHAHLAEPGAWDAYDVRLTADEGLRIEEHASRAIRSPEQLEALLGVELSSIARLAPAERGAAFRIFDEHAPTSVAAEEEALRARLGSPGPFDAYWLPFVQPCGSFLGDGYTLNAFADVLTRSATFITNARYDSVVYSSAIPEFFASASSFEVTIDRSLPEGSERPGVIVLNGELLDASIRFPSYESGHAVSVGAPRELAEDFERWLRDTGASAP